MNIQTPYYLIDEKKLLKNLEIIDSVRKISGAKVVLALKCFSTWSVFGLMKKYMDGTTSSSLYETRLGKEKFGKETHSYCVGYSKEDIREIKKYADKVIFNSISQLKKYRRQVRGLKAGLRVNPGISYSHFGLADPAGKYSRLGVTDQKALMAAAPLISGVMFHFNCENDDFENFSRNLDMISRKYGKLAGTNGMGKSWRRAVFHERRLPRRQNSRNKLKEFGQKHSVQIYLEPGESVITQCAELVTTVVDVVRNKIDIAIVDASTEAHMLDLLIYRLNGKTG